MAENGQPKSKLASRALAVFRFVLSQALGVGITLAVFLMLPLLQAILEATKPELVLRPAPTQAPPPPPEIEEEEPPEPEPPDEPPPPPPMESVEPASFSDLAGALDIGSGTGGSGAVIASALADSIARKADQAVATSSLDQGARAIAQVSPKYPADLKKQGIAGLVKVQVVVDARGRVQDARVTQGAHPLLDRAALDAVRQWRFQPAVRGGKPVAQKVMVPFRFG